MLPRNVQRFASIGKKQRNAYFDSNHHLPAGFSLVAPAFTDDALAPLADAIQRKLAPGMGRDKVASLPSESMVPASASEMVLNVVGGARLTGMPLNKGLTGPGRRMLNACRTANDYRMFALPNTPP